MTFVGVVMDLRFHWFSSIDSCVWPISTASARMLATTRTRASGCCDLGADGGRRRPAKRIRRFFANSATLRTLSSTTTCTEILTNWSTRRTNPHGSAIDRISAACWTSTDAALAAPVSILSSTSSGFFLMKMSTFFPFFGSSFSDKFSALYTKSTTFSSLLALQS